MATTHLVSLVAEKMDLLEALVLDMPQTVGLVPSSGEDIERDLSPDGVSEVVVGEFFPQDFHEGGPDFVNLLETVRGHVFRCGCGANLVVRFKLVTFRNPGTWCELIS